MKVKVFKKDKLLSSRENQKVQMYKLAVFFQIEKARSISSQLFTKLGQQACDRAVMVRTLGMTHENRRVPDPNATFNA